MCSKKIGKERGQGVRKAKEARSRKRKDSRSRGVEGSSEKGRRLEGWRVGGLAKPLHIQTSNLLKKGVEGRRSNPINPTNQRN